MKKQFGAYYLGLDMGTDSVGWAVTDESYNLQKLNGKWLWGVHLFESGKTAAERRAKRTQRRLYDRKKQRIDLLQELFAEEISKIDPGFFIRLNDSFFIPEDKHEKQKNTLFNDRSYKDKDYHKAFPTIYHLRSAFVHGEPISDPRLLYLAVAHIIKNRGNFLFTGDYKEDIGGNFLPAFENLKLAFANELGIELSVSDMNETINTLKNRSCGIAQKKKLLGNLITLENDSIKKQLVSLLSGGKGDLSVLFEEPSLTETKYKSVDLGSISEEDLSGDDSIVGLLGDRFAVLEAIMGIYDWSVLADILNSRSFISEAKVDSYEKHRRDLKTLKTVIHKYLPEQYEELMNSDKEDFPSYRNYIAVGKTTQIDFCKKIKNSLAKIGPVSEEVQYLLTEAENNSLLPRQKTGSNSVIPYQVNLSEMREILKNATVQFPFLLNKDDEGISVTDKIISLLTFRIPYYVGPLNDAHEGKESGHAWIVRKERGPVRPWNFDRTVDKAGSAEAFIRKMTIKCTYIAGEDVLPKESLLYSKFMVLNELNNLRLEGKPISVDLKQQIYTDLFLTHYHVKERELRNYLISIGAADRSTEISGIDGDFKSSLKPWIDFRKILRGRSFDEELVEKIIETIVLFSGTDILQTRLQTLCAGNFSEDEIGQIYKLKYKDWGKFSRKFLTGIYHTEKGTGEYYCIMSLLWNTNHNLMQLLSSDYDFSGKIEEYNREINDVHTEITPDLLDDLYVSPAVKRSLWRTLCIVREIRQVMGHDPERIFIEVAREEGEKQRTITRKQMLQKLYRSCRDISEDIRQDLESREDHELKQDRLYLYFLQKGRCIYSGERIELSQLNNNSIYDIDHIYPRSLTKDDSILNNRVLCLRSINKDKTDRYPLEADIQDRMRDYWYMLKQQGLMTVEKYDRLVRCTELDENELSGFISRQLVETRQSTKAVAHILQEVFPKSTVVYSKAGNVSAFRQQYDLIKVREINDLHHAKDAYLNIVVGNVFHTKFTSDPRVFFREPNHVYNLTKMYDFDVKRAGKTAWIASRKNGVPGTITTVRRYMSKNDVLFTRFSYRRTGQLFDVNILKQGNGQYPIKTSDQRYLRKDESGKFFYGAYDNVKGAYFTLVEHTVKKERVRTIEFVPIWAVQKIQNREISLADYLESLGFDSPLILIKQINMDSLLEINGFRGHLSGRTGNRLDFKSAIQLHLPNKTEAELKKVLKYVADSKERKNLTITKNNGISKDVNLSIYRLLLDKISKKPYVSVFSAPAKSLEEGVKAFKGLSAEEQCKILSEILKIFCCTSVKGDLRLIGGSSQAGTIRPSKEISKWTSAKLICQSVTGIFEKGIDLKTI